MTFHFTRALMGAATALVMSVAVASAQEGVELIDGPKTFAIDASHSSVLLSWSHLGLSTTHAVIRNFSGTLELDPANIADASLSVVFDLASIDSLFEARTTDLQSERFFNVAAFPEATFVSTEVVQTGDTTADVTGDFTVLGQTFPLTLAVTFNKAAMNNDALIVGFDADAVIRRADYGVTTLAEVVGPEITIAASTELRAQ